MSIRQSDMMFLRAASIGHMNNMWDFVNNHGVDVDIFDKYGRSACHYAVANGNLEMVEYLIECGADMNAPERLTGMTPVHLAVEKYQLEILHLLLSQNDVNPNLACLQVHVGFTLFIFYCTERKLQHYLDRIHSTSSCHSNELYCSYNQIDRIWYVTILI